MHYVHLGLALLVNCTIYRAGQSSNMPTAAELTAARLRIYSKHAHAYVIVDIDHRYSAIADMTFAEYQAYFPGVPFEAAYSDAYDASIAEALVREHPNRLYHYSESPGKDRAAVSRDIQQMGYLRRRLEAVGKLPSARSGDESMYEQLDRIAAARRNADQGGNPQEESLAAAQRNGRIHGNPQGNSLRPGHRAKIFRY